MNRIRYNLLAAVLGIFVLTSAAFAQGPVVFFTDLTSGPNTGGENGNGTILTIYGKNFGSTQGTVTVGGGAVAAYKQWGGRATNGHLETISVAIGSKAATGLVQVTTSAGTSTCDDKLDGCQFTVRSGNIYCVSTTGSDSNSGSFPSSCWKTIVNAKNSMKAGDITYVQNGVNQTSTDNYNADVSIGSAGTAAAPIALVTYPGASATIGNTSTPYGLRTPATSGAKDYWVLAGFNLISGSAAVDLLYVDGWRVINNNFTCPTGYGQAACFHTDTTTNLRFYGNYVHNVGDQNGSIDKYYHAVYFTTNSNHIWAGWNEVAPNPSGSTTQGGCRAVQFYSTGGSDQFDLHVFGNLIHDAICDGINFSTVNPNNGTVEAYNNIVYHVGTGPDPANSSSNYSCIVTGGSSGGSTPAQLYNNTLYDCGARKTSDSGAIDPTIPTRIYNNIVYQLSGEYYVNPNAGTSDLSGSNNLWYGVSGAPTATTSNLTSNPLLVSPTIDFHLQSTSPAINAGTTISGLTWDFEGNVRPQGTAFDIGAYEYASGVTRPAPPTNLTGTVQ